MVYAFCLHIKRGTMTEVEKRRLKLLQDTRKTYSMHNSPPAIHPRYQSVYLSLYGTEEEEATKAGSSFLVRTMIAIFIFVLFYAMDFHNEKIGTVSREYIVSEIQKDLLGQ